MERVCGELALRRACQRFAEHASAEVSSLQVIVQLC